MNKDIDIDFASSACFDDNIYILFYSWKSAHKLPPICITHTGFCVSPDFRPRPKCPQTPTYLYNTHWVLCVPTRFGHFDCNTHNFILDNHRQCIT